ncbi:MAG: HXXEE domain-containing protein [Candidatus Acidiferrum sp.]
MLDRLITNWVYGGFLSGLLLLMLAPVVVHDWPPTLVATFLCLPVYMLHQYEEHDNDRFRLFINKTVGKGRDVLSHLAVFIINVPGVWGVIGVSIRLAATVNIGFGLIATYLLIVNGFFHILHAIIFRTYNPGLGTAIATFIPLGTFALVMIQRSGGMIWMHAAGAVVAIGIHALIIVRVFRKRTTLQRANSR